MPTIEIISVDAEKIRIALDDFRLAIIEEGQLISHRGLFYDFLVKQRGVMLHIGNQEQKIEHKFGFNGNHLIDWRYRSTENADIADDDRCPFQFLPEYLPEIRKLLEIALASSPIGKMYFLTDIQLNNEKAMYTAVTTIQELWDLHDRRGLIFNTLYEIGPFI